VAPKLPIGKVLLAQKKIDQTQLSQALDRQNTEGGRLASTLLSMGLAGEEDLLKALGEQQGVPAVDLTQSIIPLKVLDIVPQKVAEAAKILPLAVFNDRVLLAMANPQDQQIIDEISFVTGKKVEAYVAIEVRLQQVLREANALRRRDPSISFYFGQRAEFPNGVEKADGHLVLFAQSLPEPDTSMLPDEELISIEISADDADEELELELEVVAPDSGLILVVDDEEDIVRMLEKALLSEGFRVVTATRGLEALQAVKKHSPHLVLLDAMLPEIHGFEICKKIKTSKRFGHIPVVMISAVYRGWRYALDAKETYGADDYFEKPFRIVPLVRRLRELLASETTIIQSEIDEEAADKAYQKGVVLYREKKYEEAEAALRRATSLDPFSANVHYAMANVLLARNMIYEAMREYEQTVELKPELFSPLRNLAILYQKKGFRNKAVEMWERALRFSPEGERERVKQQLLKLL
jgi:DNA-binding response OmpR family regulator